MNNRNRLAGRILLAVAVGGSALCLSLAGCSSQQEQFALEFGQVICNAGPTGSPSLVALVDPVGSPIESVGKPAGYAAAACTLIGAVAATQQQIANAQAETLTVAPQNQGPVIAPVVPAVTANAIVDPTKINGAATGIIIQSK